jgi:hypothetical protein
MMRSGNEEFRTRFVLVVTLPAKPSLPAENLPLNTPPKTMESV